MFISQALAASPEEATSAAEGATEHAAAIAEHAVPFYEHPTFWVALAVIVFFVVFGKKLGVAVGGMLDERAQKIQDQIEEATRLREDAQEMLASFEKKQHEALKEAENIVAAAKDEAERLAVEAAAQLDHNLKRSEQLAADRITQAQAQAIAEVKNMAVEIALDASKRILTSDITATKANSLIDGAIKDIAGKLN